MNWTILNFPSELNFRIEQRQGLIFNMALVIKKNSNDFVAYEREVGVVVIGIAKETRVFSETVFIKVFYKIENYLGFGPEKDNTKISLEEKCFISIPASPLKSPTLNLQRKKTTLPKHSSSSMGSQALHWTTIESLMIFRNWAELSCSTILALGYQRSQRKILGTSYKTTRKIS